MDGWVEKEDWAVPINSQGEYSTERSIYPGDCVSTGLLSPPAITYQQYRQDYTVDPRMVVPDDVDSTVNQGYWSPVHSEENGGHNYVTQPYTQVKVPGQAMYSVLVPQLEMKCRNYFEYPNSNYQLFAPAVVVNVSPEYDSTETQGVPFKHFCSRESEKSSDKPTEETKCIGIAFQNPEGLDYLSHEETIPSDNTRADGNSCTSPQQIDALEEEIHGYMDLTTQHDGAETFVFSQDEFNAAFVPGNVIEEIMVGKVEEVEFASPSLCPVYKAEDSHPLELFEYDTTDGPFGNAQKFCSTTNADSSPTPTSSDSLDPEWTFKTVKRRKRKQGQNANRESKRARNKRTSRKETPKRTALVKKKCANHTTGTSAARSVRNSVNTKEGSKYLGVVTVGRRNKVDTNSFRYKMGPHLRALSAVLEISGMKHFSQFVPHDVIRRFHPTDMFRTIEKTITTIENWSKESRAVDVEPDWVLMEEMGNNEIARSSPAVLKGQDSTSRLYYTTPFGRQCNADRAKSIRAGFISMKRDVEKNGRLSCSPEILTSVGSAELKVILNLHEVAEKCANTEMKEDDGHLTIRLKKPKCTGLLFKSGKLLVIGAKVFNEFRIATRRLARMIQKAGADVKLCRLKLHFCVGYIKLPFEINVDAMMKHSYLSKYIHYDPQIFSGVILKMKESPILCLVFSSGAVVMTEALGEEDMRNTLDKIYPMLRLFGYQA